MLAFVCTCSTLAAMGQTTRPAVQWERGEYGDTAIVPMASAPFPHESRNDGFRNGDAFFPRDPHYVDNSVAIFIPKGFDPSGRTDLLVYFHGHGNNVRKSLESFHLREQIVVGRRNLILVFPEGPKDAADSGGGRLEEPGALAGLVAEAMNLLVAERKVPTGQVGRVYLAGHSGAYRVISFCLQHGGLEDRVAGACLLDATYARHDAFPHWIKRRADARLFSIFTDHLAARNVSLMTALRRMSVPHQLASTDDATGDMLRGERVLFLHAPNLTHDQTVQWLERWLRALPATQPE